MALFGLFDKKETPKQKPKQEQKSTVKSPAKASAKPIRSYKLMSSEHFRGYKKVNLTSYHYLDSMQNIETLIEKHDSKLENLPVVIKIFMTTGFTENKPYAQVVADGLVIGAFYDRTPYFEEIINGDISGIYLKCETENVASSTDIEKRDRIRVFIKPNK